MVLNTMKFEDRVFVLNIDLLWLISKKRTWENFVARDKKIHISIFDKNLLL